MLALVIVPGLLMVSTIRFYSFKDFDLQSRRSYPILLLVALGIALSVAHEVMLLVMAYTYLASGLVMALWGRLHSRPQAEEPRPADH